MMSLLPVPPVPRHRRRQQLVIRRDGQVARQQLALGAAATETQADAPHAHATLEAGRSGAVHGQLGAHAVEGGTGGGGG